MQCSAVQCSAVQCLLPGEVDILRVGEEEEERRGGDTAPDLTQEERGVLEN